MEANMQRDSQQEKSVDAPLDANERLNALPVRSPAIRDHIPRSLPKKLARPNLSFLNDVQDGQKKLSVAIPNELSRAFDAREQSKRKIQELWKTQGSNVDEKDKAAAETKRVQFLADLEQAQKEFDYWDERVSQIYRSTVNHTSNHFNRMPPSTFNHAPSRLVPDPNGPPRPKREPVPGQKREVVTRKRDNMESEKEPHADKPFFHIDPKAPQDVTLHLEMDVTEDIEEELEEFSRLRRMGHFNAAKQYFEEHLESCIDNAYVLDQYGQFLLEISDIHTLTELARGYPAGDLDKVVSANWFLVCERAHQFDDGIGPQGNRGKRPNLRRLLRSWPKLDSTELQCLINDLRVVRNGDSKTEHTAEEYGELYAYLQHEDRIWDFRDLCYGLLGPKTLEETIHCLFSKHLSLPNETAAGVIQIIQQHWEGSDEVTSLALLDIFTAFTMWALDAANDQYENSRDDSEEIQSAKMYLKIACHYANQVLRQNPLNLRSRPYLQWVFAKILVEKNTDTTRCGQAALSKYLRNLRGGTQITTGAFRGLLPFQDIVYYIPQQDEAPNWQPDSSITFSHKQETAIQMVVRNARELGDVMLEAACLQQLEYSSPNPEVHLVDLCNLWRSVGNRSGLLRAYLYRYILKQSPDASNDLRGDLLEFGDAACNIHLQKARFMILRALSTRSFEKNVYLKRAQYLDYEPDRNSYNRGASMKPLDIEAMYSAENNGLQACNHSGKYYSDNVLGDNDDNDNGISSVRSKNPRPHNSVRSTLNEGESLDITTDDDDDDDDDIWSVRSKCTAPHNSVRPTQNEEKPCLKSGLEWSKELPSRRDTQASAFEGRFHAGHGEKRIPDSGIDTRTTAGSVDRQDIID
ncbi:hypothetical protein LY78DRAFT_662032 [Colletotrichum sublineola]|nr:hypothetical protein LY78DRAFT_662032 [Colletotrichum sublineola]